MDSCASARRARRVGVRPRSRPQPSMNESPGPAPLKRARCAFGTVACDAAAGVPWQPSRCRRRCRSGACAEAGSASAKQAPASKPALASRPVDVAGTCHRPFPPSHSLPIALRILLRSRPSARSDAVDDPELHPPVERVAHVVGARGRPAPPSSPPRRRSASTTSARLSRSSILCTASARCRDSRSLARALPVRLVWPTMRTQAGVRAGLLRPARRARSVLLRQVADW